VKDIDKEILKVRSELYSRATARLQEAVKEEIEAEDKLLEELIAKREQDEDQNSEQK
jgi:hypothetical protein